MVGPSKILTVSYGTFSCTLEGFDDPFNTMRGIAEYFRDLAADDRYFGAEPPTPDAEMLHRIAEREIQRRVEARVGEHGITLRQVEDQSGPVAPPAPEATTAAPPAETPAKEAPAAPPPRENMFNDIGIDSASEDALEETGSDDSEGAEPAAHYAQDQGADDDLRFDEYSVAAKLSRIRAVVTRDRDMPAAMPFSGSIANAFADEAADDHMASDHDAPIDPQAEEVVDLIAEYADQGNDPLPAVDPEAAAETDMTLATEAEDLPDLTALDAPPEGPAPSAYDAAPENDPWAGPAEAFLPERTDTDLWPEAEAPEPPAPEAGPVEDVALHALDASSDAHGGAALAAKILSLRQNGPDAEGYADPADDLPEDETGEDTPSIFAEEQDDDGTDDAADDDDAAPSIFAEADEAPQEEARHADEDDLSADMASVEADDEDEEDDLDIDVDALLGRTNGVHASIPVPREITRPGMMETAPAALMSGDDDGIAAMRAAIAEASIAAEGLGTGPEDAPSNDETMHLASDEVSDDAQDDGHDTADHGAYAPRAEDASAAQSFDEPQSDDAAVDRILEQTNARMDDSDSDRRRSAIAHLKAAVAATKADRLMKRFKAPEDEAAEEQSQYRDDLAKVVRPGRPISRPRDNNPVRPQPLDDTKSPLMLVSALRVDGDGAAESSRIAPRRVGYDTGRAQGSGADDPQGFADFAEQMGATELPDLLEAAAAYAAFVEGQQEFSRPQLMRRVSSLSEQEISREAGLRSFGQLLRQGKLRKLKRGQFTITPDSRFNPESRIAGE